MPRSIAARRCPWRHDDARPFTVASALWTPAPALLSALAVARQTPSDALPNIADLSARAGVDYRADLASGERLGDARRGIWPSLAN